MIESFGPSEAVHESLRMFFIEVMRVSFGKSLTSLSKRASKLLFKPETEMAACPFSVRVRPAGIGDGFGSAGVAATMVAQAPLGNSDIFNWKEGRGGAVGFGCGC